VQDSIFAIGGSILMTR